MEISEIIRKAMEIEMDGYYHYSNASITTEDEKAKEVFQKLAEEEKKHFKILKEWEDFLSDPSSAFDYNKIKKEERLQLSGESPIFSNEFKKRIKEKNIEISALSIGMLLEQNSINFYRGWAEKTEDENAREFLLELVKWEESHLEALQKQMKFFQETFRLNARFEPF